MIKPPAPIRSPSTAVRKYSSQDLQQSDQDFLKYLDTLVMKLTRKIGLRGTDILYPKINFYSDRIKIEGIFGLRG
jgi:hypothetical protein